MSVPAEAFFLPVDGGQRFCLYYPAQAGTPRGQVLYIHPFAEEMNKARRMAALQSRALATVGFDVLQIDLLGCGDSSGDFGDATWKNWVNDVVLGCRWVRSRRNTPATGHGHVPLWLWGLRAGCLLAAEAASEMAEPCNFLFWQPPSSGKPMMQQFLRLKVAGDMLGGQSKGVMESTRAQLAQGTSVEIAGYMLSPGLVSRLEQAMLAPPVGTGETRRLEWFELSTREDVEVSPISAKTIAQWQQAGVAVGDHIVRGPAFWQTSEIEDAPALIAATTAALSSMSA